MSLITEHHIYNLQVNDHWTSYTVIAFNCLNSEKNPVLFPYLTQRVIRYFKVSTMSNFVHLGTLQIPVDFPNVIMKHPTKRSKHANLPFVNEQGRGICSKFCDQGEGRNGVKGKGKGRDGVRVEAVCQRKEGWVEGDR